MRAQGLEESTRRSQGVVVLTKPLEGQRKRLESPRERDFCLQVPHRIPTSISRLSGCQSAQVNTRKQADGCRAPAQTSPPRLWKKCWLVQAWAEATQIQVFIGWQAISHQEKNAKEERFQEDGGHGSQTSILEGFRSHGW